MRKALFVILACAIVLAAMSACSHTVAQDDRTPVNPSTATTAPTAADPSNPSSSPLEQEDFSKILSFVELFNSAATDSVRIKEPTVQKNEDGSFVVLDQGEEKLVVRLDTNGRVALVSPASGNVYSKLFVAKTVMMLLQGKELMPEEKQAIVENTKANIEEIKAEIDAAWDAAGDTELDTSLPDYSALRAEADSILKEVAELRETITGG